MCSSLDTSSNPDAFRLDRHELGAMWIPNNGNGTARRTTAGGVLTQTGLGEGRWVSLPTDDRGPCRSGLRFPACQFGLTSNRCQSRLTPVNVPEDGENVLADDPEVGLRASLALHRLAERVEASHVSAAREAGWSWQQIGDALGVTRQSVHTKYGKEF